MWCAPTWKENIFASADDELSVLNKLNFHKSEKVWIVFHTTALYCFLRYKILNESLFSLLYNFEHLIIQILNISEGLHAKEWPPFILQYNKI